MVQGGGGSRGEKLTWMFGFLTFSLDPTRNHHCPPSITYMRKKRGGTLSNSERSGVEKVHTLGVSLAGGIAKEAAVFTNNSLL